MARSGDAAFEATPCRRARFARLSECAAVFCLVTTRRQGGRKVHFVKTWAGREKRQNHSFGGSEIE